MPLNNIQIIDRLVSRALIEDGPNSRLSVTRIVSIPQPLHVLLETKKGLYAVNGFLFRTSLVSDRFYLVHTDDDEITKVEEFSNEGGRLQAVREAA